jgi:menaquinone-specific isochorismate synthase
MKTSQVAPRLIAYTRALSHVIPYDFLRAFDGEPRIFWQRGQYSTAYAGAGAAFVARARGEGRFDAVRAQVESALATLHHDTNAPSDVRPRFFGGVAFEPEGADDAPWSSFGSAQMLLPRLLLTRAGGYSWLTVTDAGAGEIEDRHNRLKQTFSRVVERLQTVCNGDVPAHQIEMDTLVSRPEWQRMIEDGVGRIRAGVLRKVVLSRALEVQMDRPVDAVGALANLERAYPTAFRFMVEPQPGHIFFGASPELLARLEGGGLQMHALAGSAPRSSTPDEDDRIAAELLASAKDRHEHALVVDWLRETLTPLSRTVEIPNEPVVTKLKHIQHLFTPVQAQLRDKSHLLQVIERLHPTPALGGDPQREARAAIREIEPLPRGWYGAPVGWIDAHGEGEFAVAIRSALAYEDRVRLFAGAGIVADSDPQREWDETAIKFKPIMGAIGIDCEGRGAVFEKTPDVVLTDALEGVAS